MAEDSTRPTRRGRTTEAALQAAARRVIAKKGFLNTTIADIAVEAGKSPASFYNYYDSKEDLLAFWAKDFRNEAAARSRASYDAEAGRREVIVRNVRAHWNTYKERLAEMVGIQQFAMVNDEFADLWQSVCADAIRMIAKSIEKARADGAPEGRNAWLIASAIVSMLNQFCYVWLAQGGEAIEIEFDEEEAIQVLADIWHNAVYCPVADA